MHEIEYYQNLVQELLKLSKETEWVEFKHNDERPDDIGGYISALANSAALCGKSHAYLIWGIDDKTHEIIGTSFRVRNCKVGGEDLESWLLHMLAPKIGFWFRELDFNGRTVTLLEINAAHGEPVQFKGVDHIRVGSYKKSLKDFPDKESALWRLFDTTPFECRIAEKTLTDDEVLKLINYPDYFDLLSIPLPTGPIAILDYFFKDGLIKIEDCGKWDITNLGAILFARSLNDFPSLKRKAIRVIQYDGDSRVRTLRERDGIYGYASGFKGLISYINGLLPSNEVIEQALRKRVPMFPELAVRELVANALIHQDFTQTGNGPMIEIFKSRMEITNPGVPLVETNRFLDSPPKSRNEALASLMRRMAICEERGSGIDKVVSETELFQLPAPIFEIAGESTRATLFAHKNLKDMSKDDKIRACYLHSSLRFVSGKPMTNGSLRERFKVEERNRAIISRIIGDTISASQILPLDPQQGRRHAKYIPFWAGPLFKDDLKSI
jgi:ATP-dependent DNA helicase RecG